MPKTLKIKYFLYSYFVLIVIAMTIGSATSKLNELLSPKNIPDHIIHIEKAILTEAQDLYLVLKITNDKIQGFQFIEIQFNYDSILQYYQWNSAPDIVLFNDHAIQSGIHSFSKIFSNDSLPAPHISAYSFNFSRQLVIRPPDFIFSDISGKNISDKIQIENQGNLQLKFSPEHAHFNSRLILNINNETVESSQWLYLGYPFAYAFDILTFPIQFIWVLINFKHPFKN